MGGARLAQIAVLLAVMPFARDEKALLAATRADDLDPLGVAERLALTLLFGVLLGVFRFRPFWVRLPPAPLFFGWGQRHF